MSGPPQSQQLRRQVLRVRQCGRDVFCHAHIVLCVDWDKLTRETLLSLGADDEMVPGAKLREHMVRAGYAAGFDTPAHVAKSDTSFAAGRTITVT